MLTSPIPVMLSLVHQGLLAPMHSVMLVLWPQIPCCGWWYSEHQWKLGAGVRC